MRTTINIDDELLAQAQKSTGILQKTKLVEEALRRLLTQEARATATDFMINYGGTDPSAKAGTRRNPWKGK
jgi:Arc/MetJ family transcription regulator